MDGLAPKLPHANCEDCTLKQYKLLRPSGPTTARVAVVGEAPGGREIAQQKPLVGDSGQLLKKVLQEHGIKEDEIYYTNLCMCKPPYERPPTNDEIACCQPRLHSELETLDVQVVIAAGALPAKALTGSKENISKLRMAGTQPCMAGNAPVVTTYHPAYALRNSSALPSIIQDIDRALKVVVRGQVVYEPTNYKVFTDPEESVRALNELSNYPTVAIDVEVCANDRASHGSPNDFTFLCIGVSHRPGAAVVFDEEVLRHSNVSSAMANMLVRTRGIYHNGKFDTQYLRRFTTDAKVADDTMLLHYMLDERPGTHDLEQVSVNYLDAPRFKTEAKAGLEEATRSLAFLPKDILWKYNAQDVDHTHRLVEPLTRLMRRDDTERPYRELLIPGSNLIADMEFNGLHIDFTKLDSLESEFNYALELLQVKFDAWGVNPRSPKQIKEALDRLGWPVNDTTAQTLQLMKDPTDPAYEFARELLDYKKKHKVQSTYVAGLRQHIRGGKVHPQYWLHGTETGRLSSRRPNIQNQVREHGIRDMFVASPGMEFVQGDYSGVELRLAGAFSNDPYLKQTFIDGRSPHREAATSIFGPDYTKEEYVLAKSVNFGTLYRETASHLADRLDTTVQVTQKMINAFFERSPELKRYHARLARSVKQDGYLVSHFGRKRRFYLLTHNNQDQVFKEAYNFPLQSAASDFTLSAAIRLHKRLAGQATPVITVHDSLVFECAPEHVPDVARIMKEEMETVVNDVPLTVEFARGPIWGQVKEFNV